MRHDRSDQPFPRENRAFLWRRSHRARGLRLPALVALLLLVTGVLAGCAPQFNGLRLTVTTGSPGAVYYQVGNVLSTAWASDLSITRPAVLTSAGSGQNLDRLLSGQADVGISAADAAALRATQPGGQHLRALARIHDDYVQVVVPANSPVWKLSDLRGLRVSVGAADSGVELIADRLLAQAGLGHPGDVQRQQLSLDDSVNALARGDIAALFWSGGIPTEQITALARRLPIRVLDLSDVTSAMCAMYPEYEVATLPASVYHLRSPATTLLLRNFLLVTDRMPDAVAEALTKGVFDAQPALAAANPAARSIDSMSGIETTPLPLHPGAVAYYRSSTP